MKKSIFALLLVLVSASILMGQETGEKKKETYYVGYVADALTHQAVDSGMVWLMKTDSTKLHGSSLYSYNYTSTKRVTSFTLPLEKPGSFLVCVEAKGYETKYVPLEIKRFYKNERYINRERPIYLRKQSEDKELAEVVVKATKVKFYHDGDTLVFNADAFQMAEGSMLDELIRQLPGVKLKEGGEIEVNGRHVDELLLNGKNFFNHDRELLLDNLPSYMVQSIQAYERMDELHGGSNFSDFAERQYVMDVKLKREYQIGWASNVEAGMGTDERWLARLFGMRFTPHSRLVLFGNANNVNDNRKPGQDGNWTPLEQGTGLMDTYDMGGNWNVEQKDNNWHYQGDARYTYSESKDDTRSTGETFLTGGNTYARSHYDAQSYDHKLRSYHALSISRRSIWRNCLKDIFIHFSPSVDYHQWHNHSTSADVTLSDNVAERWGKEWVDSLMAPQAGELLRTYAINRTLNQARGNGHSLNSSASWTFQFNPAHNDNLAFLFYGHLSYARTQQRDFDHYLLEYPTQFLTAATSLQPSHDFRNRHDHTYNRHFSTSIHSELQYRLAQFNMLSFSYELSSTHQRNNRSLYLLNRLEGWGKDTSHSLGMLPSTTELLLALDQGNSSHSRTTSLLNEPCLHYQYAKYTNKNTRIFSVHLPFQIERNGLHYQRAQLDTLFHHDNILFSPRLSYQFKQQERNRELKANYELKTSSPSMTQFLNIRDDSNPLYITHGNPHLKNQHIHEWSAEYRDHFRFDPKESEHRFPATIFHADAYFRLQQNAIAMSSIYDKSTGIRTVTPENINGNWYAHFRAGITQPLDRQQ
ncbi:MAG: outer membrane beta-barrel protein, partial [Bacteroidaceae bacterium]|nr:outer membrane beta-barrel protein [Bacteroidaceae bacterium]